MFAQVIQGGTRPELGMSTRTALVEAIEAVVRVDRPPRHTVDLVAAALRPFLDCPDLLDDAQRTGDPTGYRQHVLHVAEDGSFSVVALVWLPGQATPIHDHLSWCVVGVHLGTEYETRYRLVDGFLMEDGHDRSRRGSVTGLVPPGDIHQVHNDGDELAVSVHVYGVDVRRLGSSIHRRYDHVPVRSTQPAIPL